MTEIRIGFIHPGEMGISLAATAQNSGMQVYWASSGRSAATAQRASQYHLQDAHTIAGLCKTCSVLVSICPPHAAEDVAKSVLESGFKGLFLDANAISPHRAERIARRLSDNGIDFVDGSIIGGPAWRENSTFMYLSGPRASDAAACFHAGPLVTEVIGDETNKASALKMVFAAYTKGSTALLCAILATAERLGVRENLYKQWSHGDPAFAERAEHRAQGVTSKAWRYAGEMEEISATFAQAGLPGGFHAAAAEVYYRLAHFKDANGTPSLDDIFEALSTGEEDPEV